MKQKKRLTRQGKKKKHGNAENYRRAKAEEKRKTAAQKLNKELSVL